MIESAQLWHRNEAIFLEALDCAEPQRTAVLLRHCAGDETLMAEMRALLAACEAEEAHRTTSHAHSQTGAERHIGAYAVERLIGRGGMGAVYLAHRHDGQFRQQVAIKVIDMPLATEAFRNRFRTERQILAGLTHPYIARLLDGGVTDGGELYLAMEYIDGVSIMDFCNREGLRIPERLRLFLKVLEAVQYAHGNLIVHRDLKPDNILVSADGAPHLLDFGTAQILSPVPVLSELTAAGMHLFTPRYASPEQVLGRPVGITSDLYSLGVLLYLLLTDRAPYLLTDNSFDEMMRVICHEQPQRPSAGILPHGSFGTDLDSIVLKALRKEPEQRYTTAEQFSEDLRAYLARRPVRARRGNLRYLAEKFLSRHRVAVVALSVILVILMAGVAAILRQSHIAEQQRQRAEARSADLSELSNSLLSELDEALKDIPGSTGAQQLLVTRVLEHLDHMATDSQGDRQMTLDLVDAYTRLGNVQSNSYLQNIGDSPGALISFQKALKLAAPLATSRPQDIQVLRSYAQALEAQGELLSTSGRAVEAANDLQQATQLYDRAIALPHATPALLMEAAALYEVLGNVSGEDAGLANPDSATRAYRRALELQQLAVSRDPGSIAARRGVPFIHMHLGNLILETDPWTARQEFELSLQMSDALPETQRKKQQQIRFRALLVRKIASADRELGEYEAAMPLFTQALQSYQELYNVDTRNVGALGDLYRVLTDQASGYEFAADPLLADTAGKTTAARRRNLESASTALKQCAVVVGQILRLAPAQQNWNPVLDDVLLRLNSAQVALGRTPMALEQMAASVSHLTKAAENPSATADDVRVAVPALLYTGATRNTAQAVRLAERGVMYTHEREAPYLLLLAHAQNANGQHQRAAVSAQQGLDLLPLGEHNQPLSRLRKLLLAERVPH